MAEARRQYLATALNGVLPRFETTHNWAQALRPWRAGAWDLSMDIGRDTATALRWLDHIDGVRTEASWSEHLAAQLVQAAHSLAPLAAAQAPDGREAWAAEMGQQVVPEASALLRWEALVQRLAWLWLGQASFATDVLWSAQVAQQWPLLATVPGWSDDALTQALSAHWRAQRAEAVTLPRPQWAGLAPGALAHVPRCLACTDLHDEAVEAASEVLQALSTGARRVALVATDRAVTRRAVALLETRGVRVRDETGWRLSTSRLAAAVMAVLDAATPMANTDRWVNALLHLPVAPHAAVLALEQRWRDQGDWRPSARADDPEWLVNVREALTALRESRSFNRWQQDVPTELMRLGLLDEMRADAVGQRLIEVAGWDAPNQGELPKVWRHMSLGRYLAWLRSAWEGAPFRPEFAPNDPVVVVPLAQVLMRDVDALVIPGCDHASMPVAVQPPGPWTQVQREVAGLPDRVALTQAFAQAWSSALAHPRVSLLWRTQDGSEGIAPSHWLQRAVPADVLIAADTSARAAPMVSVTCAVTAPPSPVLQGADQSLLPVRVSATRYQRLRACPYQFFVADVLGLSADEELDELASRRDLGLWLHDVLRDFHTHEPEAVQRDGGLCAQRLDHWAEQVRLNLGLDETAFLPYQASWPLLRDGYVQWLQQHRNTGARVWQLEQTWRFELDVGQGRSLEVMGQLDRVDRSDLAQPEQAGAQPRLWVMDYKTERAEAARKRARSGTEDTQLAFYAALAQHAVPEAEVTAAYVCVGDANREAGEAGTRWEEHADVMPDAHRVMQGVKQDWQSLWAGAAMLALGESPACDHCRARGLCRRDVWEAEHA